MFYEIRILRSVSEIIMRRFLAVALSLILAVTCLPQASYADAVNYDGFPTLQEPDVTVLTTNLGTINTLIRREP